MAKQHVTLYRLKPDVKTFDAAIKGKPPRVLDLDRSAFDFDARLYVEDTDPREPRWAAFVRDGFGSLNFAKSPTVRAALLLKPAFQTSRPGLRQLPTCQSTHSRRRPPAAKGGGARR